jgi:hypothetical protein
MSTEPPGAQAGFRNDASTTAGADTLQVQHRGDDLFLSPSARTSFTRVDVPPAADEEEGQESSELHVEQAVEVEAGDRQPAVPQTPQVSLTFLLVSGKRRTMSFDPETTVGRAKELVWNAWPNGASSQSMWGAYSLINSRPLPPELTLCYILTGCITP